jgi:hypothetical protein
MIRMRQGSDSSNAKGLALLGLLPQWDWRNDPRNPATSVAFFNSAEAQLLTWILLS